MLLTFALAGCVNWEPQQWGGGGTRYASGYAGGEPISDDTGGGGGGDEGAPVIVGSTAEMQTNEAGEVYAYINIAYEDAEGDVVGGSVFYQASVAGVEQSSGDRQISSSPTADLDTEAYDEGGLLRMRVGPLEDVGTYSFQVWIVDYTHNTSEAATVDAVSE